MKNINALRSPYITTFASNSLIQISGFINSIILARFLGAEGRGEVEAVILWPVLLAALGQIGFGEAVLYFAAQDKQKMNAIFTSIMLCILVTSIVVITIGSQIMPFLLAIQRPEIVALSIGVLICIPFIMFTTSIHAAIRSQMGIRTYNMLQLIVPVGNTITNVGLALTGLLTVKMVVVSLVFWYISSALISIITLIVRRDITGFQLDRKLTQSMLAYGWKVYFGNVINQANISLDQAIMVAFISPTQFGLYVVAVKVAGITSVIPQVVRTVETPRIARIQDYSARVERFIFIFARFLRLSLGIKIAFCFLVPILIPLIYGPEFSGAVIPALILIIGSIFLDARFVLTGGAQALNLPWLSARSDMVALVLTLCFLPIALLTLGILGAAIVSLIAYSITSYVLMHALSQHLAIPKNNWYQIRQQR